ncbi:MAG: extensin family protein [Hyphomicrobiaceae bacterium]|nr:extensin family protein [Hyphomicrobiaceae bacterium]
MRRSAARRAASRNGGAAAATVPATRRDDPDPGAGTPPARTPDAAALSDRRKEPATRLGESHKKSAAVPSQDKPPEEWSAEEIATQSAECDSLLASVEAEALLEPPLRVGQCGTPVPIRLSQIGSGDGVVLKPAALLNCRMVSRLYNWLETIAQPAANTHFKSRIVRLGNASAYICRNRYNDPAAKISEHAFANAIDIAAFELADGRRIDVKTYWGSRIEVAPASDAPKSDPAKQRDSATLRQTLKARTLTSGASTAPDAPRLVSTAAPLAADTSASGTGPGNNELAFLRTLHKGACGIFTTVLGPEANKAHHDHFHFDLAKRRNSAYCQ